jgi:hypothetical protein
MLRIRSPDRPDRSESLLRNVITSQPLTTQHIVASSTSWLVREWEASKLLGFGGFWFVETVRFPFCVHGVYRGQRNCLWNICLTLQWRWIYRPERWGGECKICSPLNSVNVRTMHRGRQRTRNWRSSRSWFRASSFIKLNKTQRDAQLF